MVVLNQREEELMQRQKWLEELKKETAKKEKSKKQMLLRFAPSLWNELAKCAEADFRSINGQVESLLTECVKHQNGGAG